jgi:F0F1-type ATP synthase membrane subunit b/b'
MSAPFLYSALAAATARAPQAHEQQLLDVDSTLFLNLGLFLLTMFLLTQFLWKPYLRVRAERSSRVEGYREEARRLEAEAAARLSKVEAELGDARRAGSSERARVRVVAHKREQEILSAAQSAAQRTLTEAKARVEAAYVTERTNLAGRAEALGREAAERVLGRRLA